MKKYIIIMLILLPVNLFALCNDELIKSDSDKSINRQNKLFVNSHKYFNESFFKKNPVDSTNNFHKSLKVGLYGSKLVPSSMCQFQNSNGFSTKIIWEFAECNSASFDFTYIFNSVENKSTNTRSSYFNEISINYRAYLERYDFNIFFNFGLNSFSYYDPNNGIYGSATHLLSLSAGIGLDYLINEKISIEALSKACIFYGLGKYYTINLGLNYRIFDY